MTLLIGKTAEFLMAELPTVTPAADGAITPQASYVSLNGAATTRQMTLANASVANGMRRKMMLFEAVDVSQTVDVDFNDETGAKTWTPANAGEMLLLLGSENGAWNVFFGKNVA